MRHVLYTILALSIAMPSAGADEQMWVESDRLNRRTCPSYECGIVGILFFRESAVVLEERDGWGRITKYYDASCRDGRSDYVDSGNASCSPENGIVNGQMAEWVALEFLVVEQPADPALGATGVAKLVGGSDDFHIYEAAFVRAAEALIASGECSDQDFDQWGGFLKSSNHATQPIYFAYCKGGADRIYLNVVSGETFR